MNAKLLQKESKPAGKQKGGRMDTRPRIVLIEDNALIRAGEKMLLEDAGYQVTEIASGSESMPQESALNEVQAIITDFDLGPGKSGFEVALEIMRLYGKQIPTLVVSADFGQRLAKQAAEHGMRLMAKPVSDSKILQWLNEEGVHLNPGTAEDDDVAHRAPWPNRLS